MKVALLGNMNNNFLSLMRYLRDKGVDAHLLLYKDELEVFKPENDTWYFEKWKPFIHQTNILNGSLFKYIFTSSTTYKKELGDYDFYIGNGFSRAIFLKANVKLNLFIPYSPGVEFVWGFNVNINVFNGLKNFRTSIFKKIYQYFQIKGLKKNTSEVFVFEKGCEEVCKKLHVPFSYKAMPMLYLEKPSLKVEHLDKYIEIFKQYDWVLFSHVSHRYLNVPEFYDFKKNYILINGFAKYIKHNSSSNALLVLLEYGEDVWYSKKLIEEFEISKNVLWIPKQTRKEIMYLLQFVHIGASEFGGLLWGGTGWEFMASGVPFLHYLKMTANEFSEATQNPMPNLLQAKTEEDVFLHLMEFQENPEKYKKIGDSLSEWFSMYNGESLSEKYIQFINNSNK